MKIGELTDKLYHEGIEKANQEAESIRKKAEEEAAQLLSSAKQEAESIVAAAKNEAESLQRRTSSEITLASRQAVDALKSQIAAIVAKSVLSSAVNGAMSDGEFMKKFLLTVAQRWSVDSTTLDATLTFDEKDREAIETFVRSEAGKVLGKGVDVRFEDSFGDGFRIEPKDSSFYISFTSDAFNSFFLPFVRQKTREALFPAD